MHALLRLSCSQRLVFSIASDWPVPTILLRALRSTIETQLLYFSYHHLPDLVGLCPSVWDCCSGALGELRISCKYLPVDFCDDAVLLPDLVSLAIRETLRVSYQPG